MFTVLIIMSFVLSAIAPPKPEGITCNQLPSLSITVPPLSLSPDSYVISNYTIKLRATTAGFTGWNYSDVVQFSASDVSKTFDVIPGVNYSVEVSSVTGDVFSVSDPIYCTARKCVLVILV